MFPVSPARTRNRGRGFAFNRGAKIPPSLLLRFNEGIVDPRITYTGSNGTYFNSSGTLTAATTNVARLDYNPSTLIARGLLIEEARTNSIRNNTMQGASAPSTYPTNWVISLNGTATGSVSAVSTEDGISYIDIRIQESVSGASSIIFEATTQIVAADTQTWTNSLYYKLSGGSLTNVSLVENRIVYRTAAGAAVTSQNVAFTPTSAALRTQRVTNTFTASGGTIARVTGQVAVTFTGAGDITLRIGMPQLELGAFATSVISTSSAAVTRSADIASITGASFSSFWNATQGTIVVRATQPTLTGGVPTLYSADSTASSFTERVLGFLNSSTPETRVTTGGVEQATLSLTGTITAGTQFAVAQAYKANDFASVKNGGTVFTDTSGTLPTVDRMEIGSISGLNLFNGWIQYIEYYPVRDRDAFLRASTL